MRCKTAAGVGLCSAVWKRGRVKRRKCGRSGSCPALHDNKLHAKNTTDSLLSINTPPLSPSRSPVITSQFCSSSGSCPMPMFISCLAAPGSKALDSTRPPCSWNLASSTTTPFPPKAISRAAAFAVTDLPHQEQEGWEKVSELQCTTAASQITFSTISTRYQHRVYKSEPPHSHLPPPIQADCAGMLLTMSSI